MTSAKSFYIYSLLDPVSGSTRYVGYSDNPARRLREHIGQARRGDQSHKARWLRGQMDTELLERLAEAAHDVWMEGKIRDGWTYAPATEKAAKVHSCLVPYSELSEADKESDRDLIRGLPVILEKANCYIASREPKDLNSGRAY